MPEVSRLVIADSISGRYTRTCLVVYGVATLCLVLFIALIVSLNPSFLLFVALALFLLLGALVCVMRNPLGLLTLRVQKKMSAFEFIFEGNNLMLVPLDGLPFNFESPEAELVLIPGPGGHDYFLCLKDIKGKTGTFYVGNDVPEIETLAEFFLQNNCSIKYEKPQQPGDVNLKPRYDQFFS